MAKNPKIVQMIGINLRKVANMFYSWCTLCPKSLSCIDFVTVLLHREDLKLLSKMCSSQILRSSLDEREAASLSRITMSTVIRQRLTFVGKQQCVAQYFCASKKFYVTLFSPHSKHSNGDIKLLWHHALVFSSQRKGQSVQQQAGSVEMRIT